LHSRFRSVSYFHCLVLGVVIFGSWCVAQTVPSADELTKMQADITKLVSEPAQVDAALKQIEALWNHDRARVASGMRSWARPLLAAGRFQEVDTWTARSIPLSASDTGGLEQLLTARARALLALNRTAEALAVAKSLYNVCPLPSSGSAMLLVAECLNAAYPPATQPSTAPTATAPERTPADRFRNEQVAGATYAGKQPLVEPGKRSATLDAIRIDPTDYITELKKQIGEDYGSLALRGNLLLMADRPNEAMGIFERAYALAIEWQVTQASESIGRCLRAQDGTIGRANAWVQSIRPAGKKP
jgi:hypothetical protein